MAKPTRGPTAGDDVRGDGQDLHHEQGKFLFVGVERRLVLHGQAKVGADDVWEGDGAVCRDDGVTLDVL
jgi:hypothetical protein